jgi:uncharacterized RDD family membrane protein YckC
MSVSSSPLIPGRSASKPLPPVRLGVWRGPQIIIVFSGRRRLKSGVLFLMDVQYKIIGGDGAEYGPASLDELQSWIGDGRVAGSTQVWRNDLAHWSPAARYVELQQALARLHASISPSLAAQAARPVGFWPRLGAYLMDRLVLMLALFLLWGPLSAWQHWPMPVLPTVLDEINMRQFVEQLLISKWLMYPFFLALTLLYNVLMNGTFGATIGKMAIGARIIRADGARLTYSRALLRALAGQLTELLWYWGYLWVPIRRDKRGMHDFIAGTRVVYP